MRCLEGLVANVRDGHSAGPGALDQGVMSSADRHMPFKNNSRVLTERR